MSDHDSQRFFVCPECGLVLDGRVDGYIFACERGHESEQMRPATVIAWPTGSGPSPEQIEAGAESLRKMKPGTNDRRGRSAEAVLLAVAEEGGKGE